MEKKERINDLIPFPFHSLAQLIILLQLRNSKEEHQTTAVPFISSRRMANLFVIVCSLIFSSSLPFVEKGEKRGGKLTELCGICEGKKERVSNRQQRDSTARES